jgi:uncharacterized protein (DUF1919 family)
MRWLRIKLLNWAMKQLWRAITAEDLIKRFDKLPAAEQRLMVEEAKAMKDMELYKWMQNEMVRATTTEFFVKATSELTYLSGKMVLWVEDVRKRKVDHIASFIVK